MKQKVFNPARLKRAREKKGLTMPELAAKLSVPTSTVMRWEEGSMVPRKGKIQLLAEKLRCPKAFFLTYPSRKPEAEAVPVLPSIPGGADVSHDNL